MKSNLKRMLAALLACLVMSAAFTGCGSSANSSEAIVMNGWTISMDEMKFYAYTIQDKIEEIYSWMIAYYGETYDSFWKGDSGDGHSMWEENLTFAVQQIVQTKLLNAYAQEHNITLDEAESIRVRNNIDAYRKDHANSAKYADATDEMISRYYTENALAYKAVLDLQKDVSTDFDYETFRRKRISGVSITPRSVVPETTPDPEAETTTEAITKIPEVSTEAQTETQTYAEDEQKTARETALKDIEQRLKNGESVDDIVAAYKDDATVIVTALTTFAASSADEVEEGKEKSSYRNYVWGLSKGEVATCEIANSNSTAAQIIGYALRCEDDDDAEYRKSAEDTELENRKTQMFQEKYQELVKNITGFHVYNDKIAAAVSYKGQTTEETTQAPTEAPTTAEPTSEEASTSPEASK